MTPCNIFAATFVLIASTANAQDTNFDFADFTKIEADAGLYVNVSIEAGFGVSATVIEGDIANLDIIQVGDTLKISRQPSGLGTLLFGNADVFDVTVTLPVLQTVEASSGAEITVAGPVSTLATIESSSGSEILVSGATLGDVSIEASSGSRVYLQGSCTSVIAAASSGSSIQTGDMPCTAGVFDASSGSEVFAKISGEVIADASSSGVIRVSGGATTITESVSSGGTITID